MKPKIIACIPAYNEEKYIAKVIVRTKKYVDKIIVCDDGSSDDTSLIARELGAIVVRHNENRGYGAALRTLFREALKHNPDIIVTIDADAQHNPDEIPRLVEPIVRGEADIVIGSRFLGKTTQPKWRILGVKTITKTVKTTFKIPGITDAQSGFRAYRADIVEKIMPEDNTMAASIEILAKAREHGLKIREVPATITTHQEASKQKPLQHLLSLITGIIQYVTDKHPLLFLGLPGTLLLIASIIMGLLFIQEYRATRVIDMPLAVATITVLIIGLLLAALGLILYGLARIRRYLELRLRET